MSVCLTFRFASNPCGTCRKYCLSTERVQISIVVIFVITVASLAVVINVILERIIRIVIVVFGEGILGLVVVVRLEWIRRHDGVFRRDENLLDRRRLWRTTVQNTGFSDRHRRVNPWCRQTAARTRDISLQRRGVHIRFRETS